MALLFHCPWENAALWLELLRKADPGLDIRVWPELGNLVDIDYALVWKLPFGVLGTLPNLKCASSLGAGVDHILNDPKLPPDLPVVRLLYPAMVNRMSEYLLLAILRHQRRVEEYAQQQRAHEWQTLPMRNADEIQVGIMGLGTLGRDAAGKLAFLGYKVAGWSRRPKELPGVRCFHGPDQLDAFLARTDFLICLLALTPETRGILSKRVFDALPQGAYVINVARGEHLAREDLLTALDSGRLAGATLDVHMPEPLPGPHPFWVHPKIVVTPHCSSMSMVTAAVPRVIENMRRVRGGLPPLNLIDRSTGY